MNQPDPEVVRGLRAVIDDFLAARRDARLEKLTPDDPNWDKIHNQYDRQAWLADAAKRVRQIQAATHILKAINPDARGINLYCKPKQLSEHELIGSHLLRDHATDVVGNAAALDVNKFLTQEYEQKTLLTWMDKDKDAMIAAMQVDDPGIAHEWIESFLGFLSTSPEEYASHTLAKQMYWLVQDDPHDDQGFHLLAPLYPSSLTQHIYTTIQEHRFGEKTKLAREAKKNNQYCEHILHTYPDLVVQKFGGTKPQNISQLNSERKGMNYLLASCPPVWRSRFLHPPYRITSIFDRFGRNKEVRVLVRELRFFLESDPPSNQATRDKRDNALSCILAEIHSLAAEYRNLPAGWSKDSRCLLPEAEMCWLDPGRSVLDAEFADLWQRMEWAGEIKHRFANWLNAGLGQNIPLGDIEHAYWADFFDDEAWQRHIHSDASMILKGGQHV